MSIQIPSITKRCNALLAEISGVKAQYGVSQWEETFIKSVKDLSFGSEKQLEILARIEKKVFGRSEYEEIYNAHKGEVMTYVD